MTARNGFDIINAIANSNGEAVLVVKTGTNPVPTRIPVKMINVSAETDTDGTTISIPCEAILPTIPDIASLYPQTATSAKIGQAAMEYLKHDLAITGSLQRTLTGKEMDEIKELLGIRSPSREIVGNSDPLLKKVQIKNVIHSAPATIVFWMDGTKTVVKAVNEEYDPEKGIAMAFVKKMFGNKGNYFNNIKKWLPKVTEAKAEDLPKETEAKAEQAPETVETEEA
jgi:hypothetical protein